MKPTHAVLDKAQAKLTSREKRKSGQGHHDDDHAITG